MLTPYLMAKNMFDELAESAFGANTLRGMMNTDLKESDQGYELDIDLPGVQNERYLRWERFIGSCRRSFYVGKGSSRRTFTPSSRTVSCACSSPR